MKSFDPASIPWIDSPTVDTDAFLQKFNRHFDVSCDLKEKLAASP